MMANRNGNCLYQGNRDLNIRKAFIFSKQPFLERNTSNKGKNEGIFAKIVSSCKAFWRKIKSNDDPDIIIWRDDEITKNASKISFQDNLEGKAVKKVKVDLFPSPNFPQLKRNLTKNNTKLDSAIKENFKLEELKKSNKLELSESFWDQYTKDSTFLSNKAKPLITNICNDEKFSKVFQDNQFLKERNIFLKKNIHSFVSENETIDEQEHKSFLKKKLQLIRKKEGKNRSIKKVCKRKCSNNILSTVISPIQIQKRKYENAMNEIPFEETHTLKLDNKLFKLDMKVEKSKEINENVIPNSIFSFLDNEKVEKPNISESMIKKEMPIEENINLENEVKPKLDLIGLPILTNSAEMKDPINLSSQNSKLQEESKFHHISENSIEIETTILPNNLSEEIIKETIIEPNKSLQTPKKSVEFSNPFLTNCQSPNINLMDIVKEGNSQSIFDKFSKNNLQQNISPFMESFDHSIGMNNLFQTAPENGLFGNEFLNPMIKSEPIKPFNFGVHQIGSSNTQMNNQMTFISPFNGNNPFISNQSMNESTSLFQPSESKRQPSFNQYVGGKRKKERIN